MSNTTPPPRHAVHVLLDHDALMFSNLESKDKKYLAEHLFPTLVPALEQLLLAVDRENQRIEMEKRLGGAQSQPLDPLNWLAAYLARHNPKHCPFLPSHPYSKIVAKAVRNASV